MRTEQEIREKYAYLYSLYLEANITDEGLIRLQVYAWILFEKI